MSVEESKPPNPPYISFRSLSNMLDRFRSEGVPRRVDRSFWGSFLNGSAGAQMMVALRSLGLVDSSDSPTDELDRMCGEEATVNDRKRILAEVLKRRYADVMKLDLPRSSWGQLEEVFKKSYGLDGETRRKAITFFINAAQYAELPLSNHITKKVRSRAPSNNTGSRANARIKVRVDGAESPEEESGKRPEDSPHSKGPGGQRSVTFRGGGVVTVSYSADLFDLADKERQFLLSLVDMLRKYDEEQEKAGQVVGTQDTGAEFDNMPF